MSVDWAENVRDSSLNSKRRFEALLSLEINDSRGILQALTTLYVEIREILQQIFYYSEMLE